MSRFHRLALAACAVTALGGAAQLATTPPAAATAQPPANRAEIEAIIRDYLLENPEIIFEAAEVYAARQEAVAQEAAKSAGREALPGLVSGETGHVEPAPSGTAEVVVVEFFDYNCGFCRRATEFVLGIQQDHPDTTLVLQELPVTHPSSREPALIALQAAGTPRYLPLHRALMTADGLVDEGRARSLARDVGVTRGDIDAALGDTDVGAALNASLDTSLDVAAALGIDGTPAFLVASADGEYIELVSGFDPAAVENAIDAARKR